MDPRPFEASVVDRLWRAALADAALGYDDVLLLSFGEHGDYYRGMAWPPDRVIEGEHDRRALGNQIDEANGAEGLGKARVAIRFDRTHEAVVAAALRHELEHVRQLATVDGEQLDDLYEVAQRVLGDEGRSAYGSEYNNIPMEVDANAAAAVFVRTLWTGETVDALVAGNVEAVLLRAANPPPPMSSLVQRMRDFIVESGNAGVADEHRGSSLFSVVVVWVLYREAVSRIDSEKTGPLCFRGFRFRCGWFSLMVVCEMFEA